jgi:hypothetical protein
MDIRIAESDAERETMKLASYHFSKAVEPDDSSNPTGFAAGDPTPAG